MAVQRCRGLTPERVKRVKGAEGTFNAYWTGRNMWDNGGDVAMLLNPEGKEVARLAREVPRSRSPPLSESQSCAEERLVRAPAHTPEIQVSSALNLAIGSRATDRFDSDRGEYRRLDPCNGELALLAVSFWVLRVCLSVCLSVCLCLSLLLFSPVVPRRRWFATRRAASGLRAQPVHRCWYLV